ncbi:MAG: nuclear transport factor 2 family protein [Rubrivivax sp.]
MHPNEAVIHRLYTAFAALDADAMQACYAPDARFRDEVFTLAGADAVGGMWRMLCEATRETGRDDWRLTHDGVRADDRSGHAHWQAHYRFSATGRLVHNVVDSTFTFAEGRIADQVDRFGFWRWSRQALGLPGWLLGATPLLRRQVRARAAANLARFRARG